MKVYKPTTPGRRGMSGIEYRKILVGGGPWKKLLLPLKKTGGRKASGTITSRHKGGGHKRRYRIVDFKRAILDQAGKVETIEYDPNRSAFIARVLYPNGVRSYMLAPSGLRQGDMVLSSLTRVPLRPGNHLPLKFIPVGTMVHNIELEPGKGGQIARSAGVGIQVMARDEGYVSLLMPSSEIRKVLENSRASIGELSNSEHRMVVIGKAGRSRW